MKVAIPVIFLMLVACQNESQTADFPEQPDSLQTRQLAQQDSTDTPKVAKELPKNKPEQLRYPWLENYDASNALINQIEPPEGYKREPAKNGSFGEWLRYLPLMKSGSKVMLYNGQEKPYQAGAYRVINIDIGKQDLQQCADAIMRLKAEYHYSQADYEAIHFNFTSGDKVAFEDWRKGKKPYLKDGDVRFSSPKGTTDDSYQNFRKYLRKIFMYAGTASLEKELKKRPLEELEAGDLFIQGGFPGHAILVVDVATNEAGKKCFLLAQSYMPAQSIHILRNPNDADLSPWYTNDFGQALRTPEWSFGQEDLMYFD